MPVLSEKHRKMLESLEVKNPDDYTFAHMSVIPDLESPDRFAKKLVYTFMNFDTNDAVYYVENV